ncbi:cation diffusion facilitator family transporter [Motilibacter peucedani]|uniref:Cation diffusion facilitator family transporter n=1 Tax=Motilibacter peucedani TaxID=598650 RepID=A0A420XPD9_9ACTN|nr:cation diffusion facilitator family transporter [Motilibacter peucedani]RKS74069.1 cation diffusion facilitator family transporter [Motilibacter peucedani]
MAEEEASTRTVVVAASANLLVALAKGVAALLTGSAAMLAETLHSVADTANELLLFVGLRRSTRPADEDHPLGWGQERYFWSLLAAVGIFVVGGLASVYEGWSAIRHPEPVESVPVGVGVLVVSMGLEGWSWLTARRQLGQEAGRRRVSRRTYLRHSSDPSATTVYLEDSAALIGLSLALAALVLHAATGQAVWDGLASIAIGVLLIAVAVLLVRRNQELLVNSSVPDPVVDRLRAAVLQADWVDEAPDVAAVWLGPSQLLLLVTVRVRPGGTAAELVDDIAALRQDLRGMGMVARVEVTPVA